MTVYFSLRLMYSNTANIRGIVYDRVARQQSGDKEELGVFIKWIFRLSLFLDDCKSRP